MYISISYQAAKMVQDLVDKHLDLLDSDIQRMVNNMDENVSPFDSMILCNRRDRRDCLVEFKRELDFWLKH